MGQASASSAACAGNVKECWTTCEPSADKLYVVWCSARGEARCRMSVISSRIYTSTSSARAAIRLRALWMGSRISITGDAANRSHRSSSPRKPLYFRMGANGFIAGRSSTPYSRSCSTKFAKSSRSLVTSNVSAGAPSARTTSWVSNSVKVIDDVTVVHIGQRN